MNSHPALRLAYVGDDFTGSTDALDVLSRAGLRTALFLEPPSLETLRRHGSLEAIGVATATRALNPRDMETRLRPVFGALKQLGPRHVHYKVCSTFDSSPHVGSIGRAIELGRETFPSTWTPLVVGAPALGRYCVFGNLFARYGIGSAGAIHRLDRHPAMQRHPVTPADESDLRLHLGHQTRLRIGLLDILTLEKPADDRRSAVSAAVQAGAEIVLFDLLSPSQLAGIGDLIDGAVVQAPLFSAGSSGVEMALAAHWSQTGAIRRSASWPTPRAVGPLLVLSGSCSSVTAGQIAWAEAHGFVSVPADPAARVENETTDRVLAALRQGKPTIVHTGRCETTATVSPEVVGGLLGRIALRAVEELQLPRVLVAGGDTSSYAARALGIEALTMLAPLAPGAPLCAVHAPGRAVHGLEINFKGGQVGAPDYLGLLAAA